MWVTSLNAAENSKSWNENYSNGFILKAYDKCSINVILEIENTWKLLSGFSNNRRNTSWKDLNIVAKMSPYLVSKYYKSHPCHEKMSELPKWATCSTCDFKGIGNRNIPHWNDIHSLMSLLIFLYTTLRQLITHYPKLSVATRNLRRSPCVTWLSCTHQRGRGGNYFCNSRSNCLTGWLFTKSFLDKVIFHR